jgi:hypothetical protein
VVYFIVCNFYLFQSELFLSFLVLICSTDAKVLKSREKADGLVEKCSRGISIASPDLGVLSSCCSGVAGRCNKTSETIINGLDKLKKSFEAFAPSDFLNLLDQQAENGDTHGPSIYWPLDEILADG